MTKLEIFNLSLDKLAISSLSTTTDGEVANLCERTYNMSREYLLSTNNWGFSIIYLPLVKVTNVYIPDSSEFSLSYVFQTTSDTVLRLLRVQDKDYSGEYVYESGVIFTNDDLADARVVVDVTDTTKFTSGFTKVLTVHMAWSMSEALTQSSSKQQSLEIELNRTLHTAGIVDIMERGSHYTVKR
jgi:hypothetical protein